MLQILHRQTSSGKKCALVIRINHMRTKPFHFTLVKHEKHTSFTTVKYILIFKNMWGHVLCCKPLLDVCATKLLLNDWFDQWSWCYALIKCCNARPYLISIHNSRHQRDKCTMQWIATHIKDVPTAFLYTVYQARELYQFTRSW